MDAFFAFRIILNRLYIAIFKLNQYEKSRKKFLKKLQQYYFARIFWGSILGLVLEKIGGH
jgi:hypothetical protein